MPAGWNNTERASAERTRPGGSTTQCQQGARHNAHWEFSGFRFVFFLLNVFSFFAFGDKIGLAFQRVVLEPILDYVHMGRGLQVEVQVTTHNRVQSSLVYSC